MRRGGRHNAQYIQSTTSVLGGSQSTHSPVLGQSQQSNATTGTRDGWLPLEAILQLDQATGRWGWGWGLGVMVFAVTGANIMVHRKQPTLRSHPARRPSTRPDHQRSEQAGSRSTVRTNNRQRGAGTRPDTMQRAPIQPAHKPFLQVKGRGPHVGNAASSLPL